MVASYFVGRITKDCKKENINATKAIYITTDTTFIPNYTNIKIKKTKKIFFPKTGKKNNPEEKNYEAKFDTIIIGPMLKPGGNQDTIKITTNVKFNLDVEAFTLDQDIAIRTFEKIITDTIRVETEKIKEVKIPNPFYNTFTFGFIIGIIITFLTGIFLR